MIDVPSARDPGVRVPDVRGRARADVAPDAAAARLSTAPDAAPTGSDEVALPADLVGEVGRALVGAGFLDYPHVEPDLVLSVLRQCGAAGARLVDELDRRGALPDSDTPYSPPRAVPSAASAHAARYAAVPAPARLFAGETWGEVWAYREIGRLLDFAELLYRDESVVTRLGLDRAFSAASRADVAALVARMRALPDQVRAALLVEIWVAGLIRPPLVVHLGARLAERLRPGRGYRYLVGRVAAQAPEATARFWVQTCAHVERGCDAEDSDSVGGWSQREVDRFLGLARDAAASPGGGRS